MPVAFAMTMLTANGDAYTSAELSDWHRRGGFKSMTKEPIPIARLPS
jgi:hypothetical protein